MLNNKYCLIKESTAIIKFYKDEFYKQVGGAKLCQKEANEQVIQETVRIGDLSLNESDVRETKKGIYVLIFKMIITNKFIPKK